MNAPHDLDRQVAAFLTDGPTELPDASFDAVRDRMETTRQRVVLGPWRVPDMSKFVPYALGAAAVVVALVAGLQFLQPTEPSGPAAVPSVQPSAMPSPTPAAAPTASPAPSATPGFVSGEGGLQPGTYTAQLSVGDNLAVTFTVPEGWTAFAEPPGVVRGLWPSGEPGTGPPGGIAIQLRDVTTLKGDPCHWSGHDDDIPVGPTVDDLVHALQEQAAYEASAPVDVVVGGYAGKRVDIVSPTEPYGGDVSDPGAAVGCDDGVLRFWDGEIYAQGPANRWRTNILDVDGTRLVIVVQDFPGTSAADRAELDAIVDSMVIKP